jgi:hypothetical protein
VTVSPTRHGFHITGSDASIYDDVRDAVVAVGAPLRRMAPERRALTELFAREGDTEGALRP